MKEKTGILYNLYLHTFNSEYVSELANIESTIFLDITDEQIEYLEKVKYHFFKIGYETAECENKFKKGILDLLVEVKND